MRRLMLLTVLALGASAARADNGFFYLGAGVVRNSLSDITALGGLPDLSNTSWKAFAGVRPLDWLAAEMDYIDLGSGSSSTSSSAGNVTAHADGKALAAYAVGFLPIPLPVVDVYGKAGLARWKLNGDVNSPGVAGKSLDQRHGIRVGHRGASAHQHVRCATRVRELQYPQHERRQDHIVVGVSEPLTTPRARRGLGHRPLAR